MREWRDKGVVVTGAASGIGEAFARAVHQRGASVALVDLSEDRLAVVAQSMRSRDGGGRVSEHIVDVGDKDRMRALPAEVLAAHGRVDVLINNAGVSVGAMFADHSIEDAEWLIQTNLMGVLYGTKFFLPHLLASQEAHIVNLSSMFGLFAMPGQAMYSASKFAVRGFTEALWTELAGTSVSLTTVHPGSIRTEIIRSARMDDDVAQARAAGLIDRFGMAPEKAAAKIIRAVERNQRRVRLGPDAILSDVLKRIFPVGFQRVLTMAFGSARGR